MKRLLLLCLFAVPAFCQSDAPNRTVTLDPSGACVDGVQNQYNMRTGDYWGCKDINGIGFGTWTKISGSGGATIPNTVNVLKGDGAGGVSTGTPGTDYVIPSGNTATATALAANGANCNAGNAPLGVSATGVSENCFRVPQQFFGTAAPGSVSGNLPGDRFSDTTNHHDYKCGATSATAAPACTTVTPGGWEQIDGASGGAANPAEFHTVTFSTTPALTPSSATAGTSDAFTLSTALSASISPTATLANFTPGQEVVVILKQAASGGPYHVTAWPTGFTCAGDVSPIANAVTTFNFSYDSAASVMRCTGAFPDSGPGVITLQSAPSSPPGAGLIFMWGDTTNTTLQVEDSSGNVYSMPRREACTNQVVTALGTNGRITCATVTAAMISTPIKVRAIGFSIGDPANSSALNTSSVSATVTVPFACTISAYNLAFGPGDTGTITVKFWKVATGTGIPTISNVINTSGVGIASGTAIHSTTLTDFTSTAVAANDMIAMVVTAVATTKSITGVLECDQ